MVAYGYGGYMAAMAAAYTSEQVRDLANAGHVPVATLAEGDVDLVQPQAINVGSTTATLPAPKLEHVDRAKLTAAAHRARRAFPGPIGLELAEILSAWAEFGFRFGGDSRIAKLVTAVMAIPFEELDLPPAA